MEHNTETGCYMTVTLDAIGGKWKGLILYHLSQRTHRFNEFIRVMPNVTHRMLVRQLRELEEHGLVARKVYAQVPPKVEYSLTELGITLLPIIKSLTEWGAMFDAHQKIT